MHCACKYVGGQRPPLMAAGHRFSLLQETGTASPTARRAPAQAPLLAHALLHHPQAWPQQNTALGLLISLRKSYQTDWVRLRMLSPLHRARDPANIILDLCIV